MMEFDKSTASQMLGRRIIGIAIKRRKPASKHVMRNCLYFMFANGSGLEIVCNGELIPCSRPEAFDLHRVTQRGGNAYDNEFLGITDPDGDGQTVLINTPAEI